MNEHDSEKISGLLSHHGMIPAPTPDEADVFILNTCSIREKSAQKVYSRLGQFKDRKKDDSDFLIGVVGCVAQQEGEAMVKRAPYVDMVVGTHLYHTIPDLLSDLDDRRHDNPSPTVATRFLDDPAPVEMESVLRQSSFRANLTIMEGCNKHCAFCVVPFTRGPERSRPAGLILEEARKAVDDGYVEILLLGQTVNSYRNPDQPRYRFASLLQDLCSIKGLQRLRFTSPHPKEFDDETIAVIGSHETICNHVHLPLQSGSSTVLKRMRRQHSRDFFIQLIEKFNATGRDIRFSTDMIVGFPGETEQAFQDTMSLVRLVEFESMFSFVYSPRPQTEALDWTDNVSENEKKRRLMLLQREQQGIQLRLHADRYLHKVFPVMVEGLAKDGQNIFGRTTTNKIVNFPGEIAPGELADVRITSVGPNALVGEPEL
jgi:tRNA-2-methylthio-N6-dimethylallyladenosine synthase